MLLLLWIMLEATKNYINHINSCTAKLKRKFLDEFGGNWGVFATSCHKELYFGLARHLIEQPEKYNQKLSEFILDKTSKLKGAKEIVERWNKSKNDIKLQSK